MGQMAAHVVEVEGDNLRALKHQLLQLQPVLSAAQLGTRLRVLITTGGATHAMAARAARHPLPLAQVRLSLEDVFVMCTARNRPMLNLQAYTATGFCDYRQRI